MSISTLRFFRQSVEYRPIAELNDLPGHLRGIYVLYQQRANGKRRAVYDLKYIGMSRSGMRGRLKRHRVAKGKIGSWSHFSVYEVWPNVTDAEIAELEGFARHLFRHDSTASAMNSARGYHKLGRLNRKSMAEWDRGNGLPR